MYENPYKPCSVVYCQGIPSNSVCAQQYAPCIFMRITVWYTTTSLYQVILIWLTSLYQVILIWLTSLYQIILIWLSTKSYHSTLFTFPFCDFFFTSLLFLKIQCNSYVQKYTRGPQHIDIHKLPSSNPNLLAQSQTHWCYRKCQNKHIHRLLILLNNPLLSTITLF